MKEDTVAWLGKHMRASAIIGGVLSIIHPDLYTSGIACLKALNSDPASIVKGERLAAVL